jgi:DNA-binding NtrC family response regulator
MTGSRGHLLVIDDEEDLRDMIAFVLRRDGFEVVPVDGGAAALNRLQVRAFDLAITDLKMPGMNGMEVLTELKKIDAAMEVIVITGYASEQTAAECTARGAYGYLRKPFDISELRSLVERALERRRAGGVVRP